MNWNKQNPDQFLFLWGSFPVKSSQAPLALLVGGRAPQWSSLLSKPSGTPTGAILIKTLLFNGLFSACEADVLLYDLGWWSFSMSPFLIMVSTVSYLYLERVPLPCFSAVGVEVRLNGFALSWRRLWRVRRRGLKRTRSPNFLKRWVEKQIQRAWCWWTVFTATQSTWETKPPCSSLAPINTLKRMRRPVFYLSHCATYCAMITLRLWWKSSPQGSIQDSVKTNSWTLRMNILYMWGFI